MKDISRFWILFARKLAHEATEEDLKELEYLIDATPELRQSTEIIFAWWKTGPVGKLNAMDTEERLEQLLHRIESNEELKPLADHWIRERKTKTASRLLNESFMFRNHFKIAWRNMVRDRQFSLLNLLGLSTGLACVLFIFLWVQDEKSIDKFHDKDSRLYRVMGNNEESGGIRTSEGAPGLLGSAFKAEVPEVEDAASVKQGQGGILSIGDKSIKATEQYTTANFFSVFSYPLIAGKPEMVLANKHNVVISDEVAKKLFGSIENITGKTITWDRGESNELYTVSGIFHLPSNSSARFDLLFTYDVLFERYGSRLQDWGSSFVSTYVLLKKGTDIVQFNNKIRNFVRSKFAANEDDQASLQHIPTIFLQKYSDQYLFNRFDNGVQAGGRIEYVRIFSIIALFILLIACINFMNLSTAKAVQREKEVGIKKVMGAQRKNLVLQYLSQSVLLSFISLIIAFGIMSAFLPVFNQITGKQFKLENNDPAFLLVASAVALITGLVAGSYPAFYLSKFKPAIVLKGKLKSSFTELFVRKGLVVFQFTLSIVFIVGVLVIYRQMNLIQSKNLGYNKDNIIQFSNEGKLKGNGLNTFLTEVRKIPGVVAASSLRYDLKAPTGFGTLGWPGQQPGDDIQFGNLEVNYDLLELFQYELKEGRSFSSQLSGEDSKIIFNESAIAAMRLKEPIGKIVSLYGKNFQVIGVVKDFHFESLHEKVKPCFFKLVPQDLPIPWNIVIKIKSGMEMETIAKLRSFYSDYNLGLAFDFKFLDNDFEILYNSERRTALLSRVFAGLAVLISCLGLFGLVAFTASNRRQEISIRKVMGATTAGIITLLSKDFFILILIALLIAFPLASWIMNQWLNDFAYRIELGTWVFILSAALIVVITSLTIGFHAFKAAVANPVKSLRTE